MTLRYGLKWPMNRVEKFRSEFSCDGCGESLTGRAGLDIAEAENGCTAMLVCLPCARAIGDAAKEDPSA